MAGRRWPGLVMALMVAAIAAGVSLVRDEQATALPKLAQQSTAPILGSLTPVWGFGASQHRQRGEQPGFAMARPANLSR